MTEQSEPRLPAFDPAELRESNLTSYPAKYRAANQTRYYRRLGDHAGLKNFGVNLIRIIPGGQSCVPARPFAPGRIRLCARGRGRAGDQ